MGRNRLSLLLFTFFFFFYSSVFCLPRCYAETLHGTPQDDTIISTGSYDGIIGYEGDDTILIESSSQIIGDSQQTAESTADADVIAIDSGSGNDQVMNSGSIGGNADAIALPGGNVASRATADAAGISAGDGADMVQNAWTIAASSRATASTGDVVLTAAGDRRVGTSTCATANATGISNGAGGLTVTNTDTISVFAEASAIAKSIELQLLDKSWADAGVTADAKAIGIITGDSDSNGAGSLNTLINSGTVAVSARSQAENTELRVQTMDWAVADATSSAVAQAIGIKAGPGTNSIENRGTIESTATSESDLWKTEFNLTDWGLGASGMTVESIATGIEGNDGSDFISNSGAITATASSGADQTEINFSFVDCTLGTGFWEELLGNSVGSGDTISKAGAVGISGEGGDDTISNSGIISAAATSSLTGTAVSIGAEGLPKSIIDVLKGDSLASAEPTAETSASGIQGGAGHDLLVNKGVITSQATSTADSISVNLSLPLLEKIIAFPSPAFALGGAGVTASAVATGIEGETGDDFILHQGSLIDVEATSETLAVTSSVALQGVWDDIDYFDLQASIADASIESEAISTGLDGGQGNDTITVGSSSTLQSDAHATAESVSVDVGIQGKIRKAINVGVSVVRADTTARATATGIEGAEGDDMINNAGTVTAGTDATAFSLDVSLEGQLSVKKAASVSAAIADTSTRALATATGLNGNGGDDQITNSGQVTANATPEADSISVLADFQNVDQALAAGISYADAETTADATAIGIEGGAGDDAVTNTSMGDINVTATPTSTSTEVTATLEGSFSQEWSGIVGGAVTDGTTDAVSTAAGVDAGEGEDTVINAGKITVTTNPDADSASVSATLTGTEDGLTAGFSYADAETTADATATGIAGGAGNDFIYNNKTGQIDVTANPTSTSADVGVTVSGVTKGTGIVGGAALSDGTTKALSNVTGITGDAGDDTITNAGKITVTSNPDTDSASVSVDVGVALGELGLVGGLSYADTATTAEATAIGIDGGTGNDTITNSGTIEVTSWPTSSGASIGVTVEAVKGLGGAIGAALTDGTTKAVSDSTGINAGDGKDSIHNSGAITVVSNSTAGSTKVSVDIVGGKEGVAAGVSYADGTTTAEATATGIADLSGKAAVVHNGNILASSSAVTDSENVSVSATGEKTGLAAGVSLADLTTHSTATSYGIDTGDTSGQEEVTAATIGSDVVWNLGTVNTDATATTTADSVAVTLSAAMTGVTAGVSAAKSDVTATTTAVGVRTGWGDDTITNNGVENADGYSLDSYAYSTASSKDVAVTVSGAWEGVALGASLAKADTQAAGTAVGIDAGDGSDTVTSHSGIRAKADSHVDSNTVSVDAPFSYKGVSAGVALSDTRTNSDADSTGISGGSGDDEVTNWSSLDAEATASTKTKTITVNIATIGAAIADASSTATAEGVGLEGGRGVDSLTNAGDIFVQATSIADDTQTTANFIGKASGNVDSTATATATGIRGDDADDETAAGDTIANLAGGSVTVTSHAKLDAKNYVVQGGGAAFADAAGTIEALATGIASGAGADTVVNGGNVDVAARSEADVSSMELQLSGVSAGKAGADLTTRATGIDVGHGNNTITNALTGSITVNSKADATAASLTVNMGVSLQRAAITAETHSTGILSGDDKDTIYNDGDIVVTGATRMGAVAGDISLVGLSTTDSVTKASVEGINAGAGDDVIVNTGSITAGNIPGGVDPMAYVEVADVSISFSKIGLGFLGSKALATGILGGNGDDTIWNTGTIRIGDDDWMSESKAVGFQGNFLEFFSLTGVGAAGETVSTGISGGQGNDGITNDSSGVLDVKASAYAISDGAADVTTFGKPTVFANATAMTTATGVSGGPGDDDIVNLGKVAAEAEARADTSTDAWVGWGNPTADSYSHAVATAWGIDAGASWNYIRNEGEISVNSIAGAYSFAKADSNVAETNSTADACSEAFSYGVAGGNDDNMVFNTATGSITATARDRTYDPQAGMETKAESDENATAKTSEPVTAYSAGISLGDGDDTVVNDGSITAESSSDASVSAHSDSWPNKASSKADVTGEATALGIAAGEGENSITNNGRIDVDAWGNAKPVADSFSRERTSVTMALAETKATAIGMEASGNLLNTLSGIIEVKARATTHAQTGSNDPESEEATATADLTAKATGIGTVSDTIRSEPDCIRNDGSITVAALTGEDDEGNPELIAQAKVDTDVTRNQAESRGASEADAAGIRVGNNNTEITNTREVNVLARSQAHLYARSDEDSDAVTGVDEDTAVMAEATGIQAGTGDNTITNSGSVTVESVVTTNSHSGASSTVYTATATSKAGASATATGIKVGDGNNTIKNEGTLTVSAENTGTTLSDYPSAHLDNAFAYAGAEDTSLTSNAVGISAGDGVNTIENHKNIIVSSSVDAEARAYANTTTTTTHAKAYAGGDAKATGIFAGNGRNTIKNYGDMTVSATADAYAKGDADEYGYAYIGYESVGAGSIPGIIAQAIGISAGHGINEIINYGTLEVNSTATAKVTAVGDTRKTIANSYATATGIHTGDGMNIVSNVGTINVAADGKDASAIGIQTGDGEDTITNDGTINATNIKSGVSSLGVAITSGAGSDQVFLMDASESNGQIDLGDGDDRLTLMGMPLVVGDVTGATGVDTLMFDGPGSIDFIPVAFENSVKQGAGTYSVPNLPTMQRIEVNQGTLQIDSSYAMADDSSFKTYMNGDGSHGQLKVNGTAQLYGELNMVKGPGVFRNGTLYDIILTDEVEGVFSSETLPEDKPLLSFQTLTYLDRVEVEALAKSCTTVAANSLQWKIAQHLDSIIPKATGDLSLVLGEFQDLSKPEFDNAFAGLSPDPYNNSTRTTLNGAQHSVETIQQRMHSLRASLKTTAAETRPGYGVWLHGLMQQGDQDGEKGYTGYDYELYGGTLGADRFLNDHMLLGISLGVWRADMDFENNMGGGDIDAFIGSLYGSWFTGRYYLDASLSYGYQEYDNTRNITIGAIERTATSDHDGNIFSGYLEGGYNYSFGRWMMGPFGTLNYLYIDEDGFTESGAGSINLSVDDRQTDAIYSQLGAVVAGRLSYENFEMMPELRLAWKHDFDVDDHVITSAFAGAPNIKFSMDGQDIERNSLMVEVGATLFHKNGFSVPIKYAAEFRDGYMAQGVFGQIRYEF